MNTYIPVGKARFVNYLDKIQAILDKAEFSENPALVVYQEDMRTPLFMLEGLSRLYKKINNHKKLKKLNVLFKYVEDLLGVIDFYDGFHKEFVNEKKIPGLITNYLNEKKDEKLEDLNDYLKEEKWIGKHKKRISKILKDLDEVKWLDEKNDTIAILDVYHDDIKKVIKKYKRKNLEFCDIENDVHEFRRELRWLSIYPQALHGLMQLKSNAEQPEFLKKYLTPEIMNSPFNVMPDGSALPYHIILNDGYFYALSWMIAQLGKLKDNGLKITILQESIAAVYKTHENVEQLIYSICDQNQQTLPQILEQSQKIATTFFSEEILQNIIA
ncbi:MAG: hypothetical protein ABI148_00565 [Ginsengibacter sp.]